jgi:serine/threonine protein kinase HipA of HipAB toxin-antitoxin module
VQLTSPLSPLFRPQNAKKREALDAAQAKKKNANFSAVIPDRDWTEEEKQVRQREKQIEGKREREREREPTVRLHSAHTRTHCMSATCAALHCIAYDENK